MSGLAAIAEATLADLKAAHEREKALFDRWHALAEAIIADGNHSSEAWRTLAEQVGA